MKLHNCWEMIECGRGPDGDRVHELGECIAATEGMGHSCWVVAGTLCGGEVQGTRAQKRETCVTCRVRKRYHRVSGHLGEVIERHFPEEQEKYLTLLKERLEHENEH